MAHTQHGIVSVGLLAAMLIGTPHAAQAGSPSEQVERLLSVADGLFEEQDFAVDAPHQIAGLASGRRQTLSVRLEAGVEYAFVAACDTDCNDIDLQIGNRDGQVLEIDDEDDDSPIVLFTPSRSGTFSLTVSMISCSQAPCAFGVTTLARHDGGDDARNKGGCACNAQSPAQPNPPRSPTTTPTPKGMQM